jgi:hypothetical protein
MLWLGLERSSRIVLMRPSVKPLFDQSAGVAAADRGQSSPFGSP